METYEVEELGKVCIWDTASYVERIDMGTYEVDGIGRLSIWDTVGYIEYHMNRLWLLYII